MKGKILDRMHKEHKNIHNTIIKMNDSTDINQIKGLLRNLNWIIEKHFFIEEKIIFDIFLLKNDNPDIKRLTEEHKKIILLLDDIGESINQKIKPDLTLLNQILVDHSRFENEVFYPYLEDNLSDENRILIIERTDEIIS